MEISEKPEHIEMFVEKSMQRKIPRDPDDQQYPSQQDIKQLYQKIKKLEEHWRFTKCDVKVNELIDVINELVKEIKALKSKQEKMRKPIQLRGNINSGD